MAGRPKKFLAERLRERRDELRLTRQDLVDQINAVRNQNISLSTVKNLENSKNRYRLPKVKSTSGSMPLELVASALEVPFGYLLAGYSRDEILKSHYGSAVKAGRIGLVDELRDGDDDDLSLRNFIQELPRDEEGLFNLPLYHFKNQFAFATIFSIERIFSGLEMLIVNEPPLIMWDDDDLDIWIQNMSLNSDDAIIFRDEFKNYRAHFRHLLQTGKKIYKVVLNTATFKRFLARKGASSRQSWVIDAKRLLERQNFNMLLHDPNNGKSGDGVHECEVLCKHNSVPVTLDDTISVQILQTPPHIFPTSYFVSPIPRDRKLIQKEISRVDNAWAEALDQYRFDDKNLGRAQKDFDVSEITMRKIDLLADMT